MSKVILPGSTKMAPVPAVLIGTGGNGFKNNLITVAWTGVLNSEPPMLSISVRSGRYSYEALEKTGEFTVNIPSVEQAELLDWCGVVSGKEHDKFAEGGVTAVAGSKVAAPIVEECPVALECKVTQKISLGTHDMFLAEILAVQVSEEFLTAEGKFDLSKKNLLAYVCGQYYALGGLIGSFGFSVKK